MGVLDIDLPIFSPEQALKPVRSYAAELKCMADTWSGPRTILLQRLRIKQQVRIPDCSGRMMERDRAWRSIHKMRGMQLADADLFLAAVELGCFWGVLGMSVHFSSLSGLPDTLFLRTPDPSESNTRH